MISKSICYDIFITASRNLQILILEVWKYGGKHDGGSHHL